LLPAGATVAGWVIFLPLDQRALFTAHDFCGLDQVAAGYRAMDERRAIKTLLRP